MRNQERLLLLYVAIYIPAVQRQDTNLRVMLFLSRKVVPNLMKCLFISSFAEKVNSVLAGYGIPMISDEDESKFTSSYIKFGGDNGQAILCAFAFPSSWVEVKKKDGLSAANYQTGDGLTFSAGAPGTARTIGDVSALAIVAEATPSDGVAKVRTLRF